MEKVEFNLSYDMWCSMYAKNIIGISEWKPKLNTALDIQITNANSKLLETNCPTFGRSFIKDKQKYTATKDLGITLKTKLKTEVSSNITPPFDFTHV